QYFGVTDDSDLARVVAKVAAANNRGSYASLVAFRDSAMAVIPKSYKGLADVASDFDSLLACYNPCRLNWEKIDEARSAYHELAKDSTPSEKLLDRFSFALEKSRNRFIPENLTLPYAAFFSGEPTCIASNGDIMVVGTANGLVKYTGRTWQTFTTEAGLPSDNILCLSVAGSKIVIGTDKGPARFNGLTCEAFDSTTAVPSGAVTAIGADEKSPSEIYAVVGNDLYHFDGKKWSNNKPYIVLLDDSPEKIAAKFSLYGTSAEASAYETKLLALNPALTAAQAPAQPVKTDSGAVDSTKAAVPDPPGALRPGDTIRVPYLAELRSKVNYIGFGLDKTVWLGTSDGVMYLDKDHWQAPGYKIDSLAQTTAVASLVAERHAEDSATAANYEATLRMFNNITGDSIPAGTKVRVYRNPAAAPVNNINSFNERMYFATDDGLLEYDGEQWGRADLKGLGHSSALAVATHRNEVWFVSRDRVVTKAKGRPEISTMYVKWLPALADDLYYTFFSYVNSTQNWGTFGGNVTFISYGKFTRTGETSPDPIGEFQSYDVAGTLSYGRAVSSRVSLGVSGKIIYSNLAPQGAGAEKGKGTSTDFAIDFGLLWRMTSRLTMGAALTNLGPKMSYIDAAQSDDLPRNLALGFAYTVIQSEYSHLIVTTELNQMLVGLNHVSDQIKATVFNSGAEFTYANLISARAGYIYDKQGQIELFTVGAGLNLLDHFKFDFAYIPSQKDSPLNNILRMSLSILP
ncbi:MAG TPA: PorV/PorQ family protein, partial [Candidatus Acidoferrum sp.]|nr:PorV/PorQ family protein [Candidatus Acidoferrum sp.]